jgi:lipopolysaccharide transport system ATP-binding protein
VRSRIPRHFLNEGEYRLELCIALRGSQWLSEPSVNAPSIRLSIEGGLSDSPYYAWRRAGALAPIFPWELMPSGEPRSAAGAGAALSSIGP